MGNPIVWVGEWSLATRFNATDDFLSKWADAQKLTYNQSAGWLVSPSFFEEGPGKVWFYTTLVLEFQDRTNELIRATVVRFIPVRFGRDEVTGQWFIGRIWKG
jgi:hypothetical protein